MDQWMINIIANHIHTQNLGICIYIDNSCKEKKVKLDPRQINSCSILDMLEMTCSFRVLITVIKKINVIF